MAEPALKCAIWPSYKATEHSVPGRSFVRRLTSERTGGMYEIARPAELNLQCFNDQARARLTTWLVDQRLHGNDWPLITEGTIQHANTRPSLPVHKRADRLLQYLSNLTSVIGEYVVLGIPSDEPDSFGSRIVSEGCTSWEAMAWSESTQTSEIQFLIDYLLENGWIKGDRHGHGLGYFTVTAHGYNHMSDQAITVDSSQAFVAIWFDDSMAGACGESIEPGIRDAGYEPLLINRKEHINRIDDEIIAEIRRSRFVVADFTHGKDGARGSVYYEAGFAHGLGLPVIFTCKKDSLEDLHFDTEHYNHIVWTNESELRVKLRNRILAAIGQGPGLNTIP